MKRTGLPMGILPETRWEEGTLPVEPGAVLVMYTDGVTEAQDGEGDFYGEDRLTAVVQEHSDQSAQAIHDAIRTDLEAFVGDAPQFDDITLVVLKRGSEN